MASDGYAPRQGHDHPRRVGGNLNSLHVARRRRAQQDHLSYAHLRRRRVLWDYRNLNVCRVASPEIVVPSKHLTIRTTFIDPQKLSSGAETR